MSLGVNFGHASGVARREDEEQPADGEEVHEAAKKNK